MAKDNELGSDDKVNVADIVIVHRFAVTVAGFWQLSSVRLITESYTHVMYKHVFVYGLFACLALHLLFLLSS